MAAHHIRHWTIGDVEVARIVEIDSLPDINPVLFQDCPPERVRRHPWLVPHYASPEGSLRMSFQAFAVRSRGRNILVDTCIGNDKSRHAPIFDQLQTGFLADLETAGFAPDRIDVVLCTHLHLDHVGWNTRRVGDRWVPTFANARYLFSRADWDFLHGLVGQPGAETEHLADSLQPVLDAGQVDFVLPGHAVTDEVDLVPTPGHTPGHVSVRIRSRGVQAMITGDLLHHPVQCAEPDLRTNFCADHEQARLTRRAFLARCADDGDFVIGSHFCDPTGGYLSRDGDGWRFDGFGAVAVSPRSRD